jgi:hypothetical protein
MVDRLLLETILRRAFFVHAGKHRGSVRVLDELKSDDRNDYTTGSAHGQERRERHARVSGHGLAAASAVPLNSPC